MSNADKEESELKLWLAAAEAARPTCINPHEFDELIAKQRARLRQPSILHNGKLMPLGHLAPRMITCPCDDIGRDLAIRVVFANHCYTKAFSATEHSADDIVHYDSPERPRVFCQVRYALSHKLPSLIDGLPTRKVHQTTQARNYVYVVPLEIGHQVYEIYFMLQRAGPDDKADLRLTVESAYSVVTPTAVAKRPQAIRFRILAHKVLTNQRVRFAPR
jgi:hypothetical protein